MGTGIMGIDDIAPITIVDRQGIVPLIGIDPINPGLLGTGIIPGAASALLDPLYGIGISMMPLFSFAAFMPDPLTNIPLNILGMAEQAMGMPVGIMGLSGPMIGMPGLFMGMPAPSIGMPFHIIDMLEPMLVAPGPMAGMPVSMMGVPIPGSMMEMTMPMIGMPGLMPIMGMPGPIMGMPGLMPIMGMPSPMMGMPGPMPMLGMPGLMPIMGMPGPMMSLPVISPLLQPHIPLPLPIPLGQTPLIRTANILGVPFAPGDSCNFCHGNLQIMTDLGYPEFYFDLLTVQAETGMPANCVDCHLGNPLDFTLAGAHIGLLGLLVMKNQYRDILKRRDVVGLEYGLVSSIQAIRLSNTNDPRYRLRVQSPFHMLLWHDRNVTTGSWNPDISMQTCGRCHPAEVTEFNTTEMGQVQTMSQYIPWIVPPIPGGLGTHLSVAPQSCGLWSAATTPPNNDLFTEDNRLLYNSTSTSIANQFFDPRYPETSADPLTKLQALANQRNCNKCHPSCLDCHFVPFEENIPAAMGPGFKPAGTHTITKRPLVMNCMGIGRGQFCHGGAIERRRGDGFIKGGFAHLPPPEVKTIDTDIYLTTPDIHYNSDILPPNASCVDCHGPLAMGGGPFAIHGDMNRNPEPNRCAVCHPATVAAYLGGTHRNVTCSACHTPKIVGYAFNLWSPGTRFGITPNPLDRHAQYAVNAMTPILLLDENGQWAPYHIVPHISTHIDPLYLLVGNYLSPRVLWRNLPDIGIIRQHFSKDGVAITGSYNGYLYGRDEGQVMVWLNIDKIAHSTTSMLSLLPPRNCTSCHTPDGTQRINVSFGWNTDPALVYQDLYMGTYEIAADGLGLRIENLRSGTLSTVLDPMRGKWSVPGSYIIPPAIGPAVGHPSGIL